ncbi:hypothetical protein IAU60_001382 [Kwoniella sp. DSM 27419]
MDTLSTDPRPSGPLPPISQKRSLQAQMAGYNIPALLEPYQALSGLLHHVPGSTTFLVSEVEAGNKGTVLWTIKGYTLGDDVLLEGDPVGRYDKHEAEAGSNIKKGPARLGTGRIVIGLTNFQKTLAYMDEDHGSLPTHLGKAAHALADAWKAGRLSIEQDDIDKEIVILVGGGSVVIRTNLNAAACDTDHVQVQLEHSRRKEVVLDIVTKLLRGRQTLFNIEYGNTPDKGLKGLTAGLDRSANDLADKLRAIHQRVVAMGATDP